MCTLKSTGKIVAVKKLKQDKTYKSRELQIHKEMHHQNVVRMRHAYFVEQKKDKGDKDKKKKKKIVENAQLNIVMDYIPSNVHRVQKHFQKLEQQVHPLLVKLYAYQLLRALNYIHTLNVMHRDIKPQNLLVDPTCHILKVCDFGSAKKVTEGSKQSVQYICSRYYRAPELMFGSRDYGTAIDIWSAGCVIGELIKGEPLFQGQLARSQLIEIIKALGSPTEEQILKMNPDYKRKAFPHVEPQPWDLVS